jgi:phosphoribosylformylglycinamidine cyclo-ligase
LDNNPELAERDIAGDTFIDIIMRPHLCYYQAMRDLFPHPGLKGMAHITGGGVEGNLNRILPNYLDAAIDKSRIRIPEIFKVIREEGQVPEADMLKTFNMGIGLTLVCAPEFVDDAVAHLAEQQYVSYPIGTIVKGTGTVAYHRRLNW